jgi:hypothetical protein
MLEDVTLQRTPTATARAGIEMLWCRLILPSTVHGVWPNRCASPPANSQLPSSGIPILGNAEN